MSAFHEIRLPINLADGARGGPEIRTEVITLASGREVRNSVWAQSRRRWDIGGAIEDMGALQDLLTFFEARRGRLHGFRFRDPLDHSSTRAGSTLSPLDQILGNGDDHRLVFGLRKTYGERVRRITKPVAGSVVVAVDGVTLDSGWTVDVTSGEIFFETPPPDGAIVSAGFEFDCAVRFEDDRIEAVIESFGAGRLLKVGLVELKGES